MSSLMTFLYTVRTALTRWQKWINTNDLLACWKGLKERAEAKQNKNEAPPERRSVCCPLSKCQMFGCGPFKSGRYNNMPASRGVKSIKKSWKWPTTWSSSFLVRCVVRKDFRRIHDIKSIAPASLLGARN